MPGIDFNRLRHEITMEQVLDLLGFECRSTSSEINGTDTARCTKSEAKHRRAFSVNVCEGCYYCHKCRSRGDQFTLWTEANKMPLHPATIDLCHQLGTRSPLGSSMVAKRNRGRRGHQYSSVGIENHRLPPLDAHQISRSLILAAYSACSGLF